MSETCFIGYDLTVVTVCERDKRCSATNRNSIINLNIRLDHIKTQITQFDPDNSNSDNSKSSLIRSNIHSPWSVLLLIFTSLIRTPVNSNHFPFAMGLRMYSIFLGHLIWFKMLKFEVRVTPNGSLLFKRYNKNYQVMAFRQLVQILGTRQHQFRRYKTDGHVLSFRQLVQELRHFKKPVTLNT